METSDPEEERPSPRRKAALVALVLLLALGCFGTMLLSAWLGWETPQRRHLAITLLSAAQADYSADLLAGAIQPLRIEIVADVLRDRNPDAPDLPERMTQVAIAFLTPIGAVPSSTPTLLPTEHATRAPLPGASLAPSETSTAGPSPTPTSTHTPGPSPTATSTHTPGPSPTATATATFGPSPTATRTSAPTGTATLTPLPSTPTPTTLPPSPTATSIPPTPTPTRSVCADLGLSGFSANGQQVSWTASNSGPASVTISGIHLDWPVTHLSLLQVELGGAVIWSQGDVLPPTDITSGWTAGASRDVGAGQNKSLTFRFAAPALMGGYSLQVTFSNGCIIVP